MDSVSKAITVAEERFVLPVDDVSIKGTIDLLAEFDDHIEIHDYKTDENLRFRDLYTFQLSVYAQAAMAHYNLPVRCFIDYVSTDLEPDEVEIWPMNLIVEHVIGGTST